MPIAGMGVARNAEIGNQDNAFNLGFLNAFDGACANGLDNTHFCTFLLGRRNSCHLAAPGAKTKNHAPLHDG